MSVIGAAYIISTEDPSPTDNDEESTAQAFLLPQKSFEEERDDLFTTRFVASEAVELLSSAAATSESKFLALKALGTISVVGPRDREKVLLASGKIVRESCSSFKSSAGTPFSARELATLKIAVGILDKLSPDIAAAFS